MPERTTKWIGSAALAAGLSLLALSPAMAVPVVGPNTGFEVTYYDVATSANPSRAGYGGPGVSGGAGDNTVRMINSRSEFGSLCAMVYVFDDFEEMQECCGCEISPDGLRTLSVVNDLTFDFGVNKANLNAGVIEVISSLVNFFNPNPPPGPTPPGTNGQCSPTGSASTDPFNRTLAVAPIPGIRSYITHDEIQQAGNINGGKAVQSVSVDEFQDSTRDFTLLTQLQNTCNFLISNGSGAGVCTCGTGDNGFGHHPGSTVSR